MNMGMMMKKSTYGGIMRLTAQKSFFVIMMVFMAGMVQAQDEKPKHARNLYWRAPDVLEGTLPEMKSADYWVKLMDAPDKVILSLEGIEGMNDGYRKRMKAWETGLDSISSKRLEREMRSRPGLLPYVPNVTAMSGKQVSQLTKEALEKQLAFLERGSFGNRLAVEYGQAELESFRTEMALSELPSEVKPMTGILVSRTLLRIIPSLRDENIGMTNNGKTRWDLWNLNALPLGQKVQVIHKSASRGFLLVVTDDGIGWVRSEQVAFGDEKHINSLTNSKDFLVVTGESAPFYSDEKNDLVSGWMGMSTRVAYKKGNPRIILVPTRKTDGTLDIQEAWIKEDADVSIGYLPYTRKNIMTQATKLLDLIYDWTGGWYGRNHATILTDLFGCFGFELPSNGILLSLYTASPDSISPEDGKEAQLETMGSNEPFVTIQVSNSGHSQLFIGTYNGMPIVFDTHGYGYKDVNGDEYEIRRSVIGTAEIPDYMLRQKMTFIKLK
ncbi:hypothetical protein [Flagellimonas pelagia]|uniref:Uncharacterized protein n=2 Tax=Flagellimonas pelagia TaxID=2306998 RepID=A0A3A1NCY7_9FLAO|nr:hypothetical protein [Allomuricauda maritima]RIV42259.1 hypothetical protein D2V05_19435 [Allomuricauda maritima]